MLYRKFLDMYSRVNKNRKHKLILKMAILGVVTSLMSFMSTTAVNTASMLTVSEVRKAENNIIIQPVSLEFSVPEQNEVEVSEVNHSVDEPVNTSEVQSTYVEPVVYQQTQVVLPVTSQQVAGSYPAVLSNGNTAGAIGSEAAAQMAAATGVSQATWEYIIARESNGNPNAANASGASGLFQTMPGWGSTATVQDQINAAINAYNNQGLAAWGM